MPSQDKTYMNISRRAGSYHVRCGRILDGRGLEKDRKILVRLGEQLKNYLDIIHAGNIPPFPYSNKYNPLIESTLGFDFVLELEERSLETDNPANKSAKELRQLGITSLDELADILISAQKPEEFDRFAEPLTGLFKWWSEETRGRAIYGYNENSIVRIYKRSRKRAS